MSRFLRSKRLRSVLYQSADGRCQICGCDLKENWHADHVIPWAVSKKTNVHEMQALCPACNLKKGNKQMQLRKHQQEMKDNAISIAAERRPFRMLCHVVCGGGKSWMPYILMNEMPSGVKLCWIVPRLALQEQAASERDGSFGIELRDSGNDCDPCRGYRGVVVTQQAFASNPDLWRDEFRRNKYILVVDEPHHAKQSFSGEKNALATAIAAVEYYCFGVVYMTGTLTTGDNRLIYGVEYFESDDGRGLQPCESGFDYFIRYSRADARKEEAIVPIKFFHHDGPVKWESLRLGTEVEVKLSEATREQESDAIWTALSTRMATGLFEQGYQHWKKHGQSLLVLCNTQSKAKEYHSRLLTLGEKSFLAISENAAAADAIREFKATKNGCLVTCAMAYEGLDHKPLSHVICLTHIRSAPWIEQALARVWRSSPGKEECFAFVPDDPRMNRVINEIKAEQPDCKRPSDATGRVGGNGGGVDDAIPIDGELAGTRLTSLDGGASTVTLNLKQVEALNALMGLGLHEESEEVQSVLRALAVSDLPPSNSTLTPSQREKALRCKIAETCRKVDQSGRLKFGVTQKRLIRHTGRSISDMNEKQLRETLRYVENLLS